MFSMFCTVNECFRQLLIILSAIIQILMSISLQVVPQIAKRAADEEEEDPTNVQASQGRPTWERPETIATVPDAFSLSFLVCRCLNAI